MKVTPLRLLSMKALLAEHGIDYLTYSYYAEEGLAYGTQKN